ncbi:alpha-1-antitrypsin homolog [Cololabis saira]|uniref:alpha-1-antitrypsin homolog n=1 Tax=Cololabis saira TaxID=129043 RepID=UPI002AD54118|nr:alpha-1-antitrypsin homolog [Cololabis saira]
MTCQLTVSELCSIMVEFLVNCIKEDLRDQLLKMRGIFAGCAVVALLLAVGSAHEVSTICHELSSPNSDFAFALYKNLNAQTDEEKNIFFSPLGISTILSMLSTGARSDTHSQLFTSLGYGSLNQSQVNEAYEHLFHMHGNSQQNQELDVGNAVALHTEFHPLDTFLNDVKRYYSGEIFNVDFSTNEAKAHINRYIANKTRDNIKDLVKDLNPAMAMVLINYVYFKGRWMNPFEEYKTYKRDFNLNDISKVKVDMMYEKGDYRTYLDTSMQATVIILPYEGTTSMMVVLPDEGKMKDVEHKINNTYVKHWKDSATEMYVDLYLPKFSISVDASLENTLRDMGIINAFQDNADFSGISDTATLKVSKVSHKTTLDVTEKGTEATAATFVYLLGSALDIIPPHPVIIDRPFLVFIMENPTGSILFMGKVHDPTAM